MFTLMKIYEYYKYKKKIKLEGVPLAKDPPLFNGSGILKTQIFLLRLISWILLEEFALLNRIVLLSISGKSP